MTFLLTTVLRGSDIKGKLSRSLPNTSTFVPIDRSQCLHCVLPIMRCAFGAQLDISLAEGRTPCRFVGNLTFPFLFLREDGCFDKTESLSCHVEHHSNHSALESLRGSQRWEDFVYGVLFVTLLAFGAKNPLNSTAKWSCCCTSDCKYFNDLTGTDGKDHSKWYFEKTFHSKVFFEKWNGNQKPKKNLRKQSWERTSVTTKRDKLG